MKSRSHWLRRIVAMVMVAGLAAVGYLYVDYSLFRRVEKLMSVVQFGFRGEEPSVEEKIECDELLQYEGVYREAASTYYRDAYRAVATDRGELVYNAMLYAFDKGYDYFSLPADICNEEQLFNCAYYAVFDHPLLEENLPLDVVSLKYTYRDRSFSFYEVTLPTNDAAHRQKKMEALARAEEIVADLPDGTAEETARRLYDWMVRNVRYIEDEDYNDTDPHYLYDALIGGATNCDGLANGYALLLNLAGVDSFNVSCVPEEEGPGHTWNILQLDGKYYQADVTAETGFFKITEENHYIHFARSSVMLANGVYEERVVDLAPPCTDEDRDLAGVDVFLTDETPSAEEWAQLSVAIHHLETGEQSIVLWCGSFAGLDEEEKTKIVGEWFRSCSVDLRLVTTEKNFCVIYRA